jgi:hypothetical protein
MDRHPYLSTVVPQSKLNRCQKLDGVPDLLWPKDVLEL